MKATDSGYAPVPGHLTAQVRDRPELREVPSSSITEYEPLLDSANARPADWLRIARDIVEHRHHYDGFVVLHGTDTMAYTASALAFLLRGLGKPVIITGSQIPLGVLRSDGRQNFLTAVLVAARDDVKEVCLVFGSKILRGARAVKSSASGFEAFASPNLPPLGLAGVEIEVDERAAAQRRSRARSGCRSTLDAPVGLLRLYPGHARRRCCERRWRRRPRAWSSRPTAPAPSPTPTPSSSTALAEGERGVVVTVVSQCVDGRVDLSAYTTSARR